MDYVDSGRQYYENQYRERVIKSLTKRAHEMGYAVVCTNTGKLVSQELSEAISVARNQRLVQSPSARSQRPDGVSFQQSILIFDFTVLKALFKD